MKIIKPTSSTPAEGDFEVKSDQQAITELLLYFVKHQITLTLWRNISGKREIYEVLAEGIQKSKGIITITPKSPTTQFPPLKTGEKWYLHASFKNFLAQITLMDYTSIRLKMLIPSQIRLQQKKVSPRRRFLTDNYKVRFVKQGVVHEYALLDISETGMAIKVPTGPATVFNYKDDEIQVLRFFEDELQDEIKGHVVYIRGIEGSQDRFRVGIAFHHPIQLEDLWEQR